MTTTIAIAGKGGVGKTLIAALLIRYIIDHQLGTVLAVDADPSTNLHLALGTTVTGAGGETEDSCGADASNHQPRAESQCRR